MNTELDQTETESEDFWIDLGIMAGRVFSPTSPIDERDLFTGRIDKIRQVVDVCNQKGQHAILFGERGVGKTSLANVLSKFFTEGGQPTIIAPRINCDSSDNYSSLWKKIFSKINLIEKSSKSGFIATPEVTTTKLIDRFKPEEEITPNEVCDTLSILSSNHIVILIIDEFDRIAYPETKLTIADTVKALSDHAIGATMILIGVADSVEQLIDDHRSIERALVQIRMPRMSQKELCQILDKGIVKLGMKIEEKVKNKIALLSQGLPHYTHLLGLNAARNAIDGKRKTVLGEDLEVAIKNALNQAEQSIIGYYHKATMSTRHDNIFTQVLLACALAKTNEHGYFAAADIREPLSFIMKKPYDIPRFSKHLYDFCEVTRGAILKKFGEKHRYKYRFRNPLLQPYITMQGFVNGLIDRQTLEEHSQIT